MNKIDSKDLTIPIINCFDNDNPKFCSFSYNSEIIYSLSDNGTFCVYKFEDLSLLYR